MVQSKAVSADPDQCSATLDDGTTLTGDYLVIAAGAQPNFFHTPGAGDFAFPLYSLTDARRVRERVLQLVGDAAAMVTGTAIAIDGGKSLGVPPTMDD